MNKLILYIDNMNRGGAQRVMANLCEHYAAMKIEVILVNDYPPDGKKTTYDLSSGIRREYLQDKYQRNPIINNIVRINRLRQLIIKEAPDIVLSFLGGPNTRMLISTMGLPIKKVVSVRNDPNKEYGNRTVVKAFTRWLFTNADGCVFQTNEAAEYFTKETQEKGRVIFNPVDEKFFQIEKSRVSEGVISVGRITFQKNHQLLIDAYEKIALRKKEKLIIYGDGPLKKQLEEYVRIKGMEEFVLFPGNIVNVEEALRKAKLFVLSSDYEGMPNALMEAMAVGVPCISTDCPCGGPRALKGDSDSVFLVPCRDRKKMANAVEMMLQNDSIRERYAQEARVRSQLFKPDKVLKEWDEYLSYVASC